MCVSTGKEYCGDGIIQTIAGEECDDHNGVSGDGCSASCKNETPTTPPSLKVVSPSDGTTYTNSPVALRYTASNANNCWFVLDSGSKIQTPCNYKTSLSIPVALRDVVYPHKINIFANSSVGTVNVSRSFNVKVTRKIKIAYNSYAGAGITSDLSLLSDTQMESASFVLDDGISGAVSFADVNFSKIAVVDPADPTTDIVDLDSYVNISGRNIEVSSESNAFNRSANITIRNVNFVSPKITKDGEDCGNVCKIWSYDTNNHQISFEVPGFTVYGVVEGYAAPPADDSGGPSGGPSGEPSTPKKVCTESIVCGAWSECADGKQKKYCYDVNSCNKTHSYYMNKDCLGNFGGGEESCDDGLSLCSDGICREDCGGVVPGTLRGLIFWIVGGIVVVGLMVLIIVMSVRSYKRGQKRAAIFGESGSKLGGSEIKKSFG
jgi:cysteine-rich repeat protein